MEKTPSVAISARLSRSVRRHKGFGVRHVGVAIAMHCRAAQLRAGMDAGM